MHKLLLIGLGGAGGAVLRYVIANWAQALHGGAFPLGTLAVNVAGCFMIGLCNPLLLGSLTMPEGYRLALTIGLLGGFTTFSAFGWETLSFANNGDWLHAAANLVTNNLLGLAAAWCGYRAALMLTAS